MLLILLWEVVMGDVGILGDDMQNIGFGLGDWVIVWGKSVKEGYEGITAFCVWIYMINVESRL